MLALMVELLVCSLAGANFGAEADSFFEDAGNRPRIGQFFLVLNPAGFAGAGTYGDRVEALIGALLADEGTRLPGARRQAFLEKGRADGVEIPDALLKEIRALADV